MEDKTFCVKCGQKISMGFMANLQRNFEGGSRPEEYSDGWYCPRCNKLKQESMRTKFK